MLVCAGDTVIKAEADLVSLSLEDIQMAFPNKKVTKDLWKKVVEDRKSTRLNSSH